MATWGGLRAGLRPSTSPPNRPPPGVPGSWTVPAPNHPARPESAGIGGPPAPDREGSSPLALRTASSSRPPCLRRCARAACGVPCSSRRSPGGRDLPRTTGWRPWPSPPTRRPGSLARHLRRHRQTAGSYARRTSRRPRGTRRAPGVHAVPELLLSLAAWEGEPPAAEAVRARDGPTRAAARLVRAGSRAASEDAGGIRIEASVKRSRRRSATLASLSAGGRGRTGPATSPRRSRRGPGWGACPAPAPSQPPAPCPPQVCITPLCRAARPRRARARARSDKRAFIGQAADARGVTAGGVRAGAHRAPAPACPVSKSARPRRRLGRAPAKTSCRAAKRPTPGR